MKSKLIYSILSIVLFLSTVPMLAQRSNGREGLEEPGGDPDAVPIDDHIWILIIVALVFGILTIRAISKKEKVVLK